MKNYYLIILFLLALAGCNGNNDENSGDIQPIEETKLVYINDGYIQCEFDGYSADETSQILINNGIDVLASYCGYISGISVGAACGFGANNINLHEINSQNIVDAENLGFAPVSELAMDDDLGYEIIDCYD